MGQFDVYKNRAGGSFPFLVDVQSDLLARLATRVIVPIARLKRYGTKPVTRLNPVVELGGTEYVLVFQEMAAISATTLGEPVGSLAARRADLVAAIDLLFTGI
jgi:toxin CcdB